MKWYNIKDKKPEEDQIVLICWKNYYFKHFDLARYVPRGNDYADSWWVAVYLGPNGIEEYPADFLEFEGKKCDLYWCELGEDTSIFDF